MPAAKNMSARSRWKRHSTPGRRILTATSRSLSPSRTLARCTCAIEAAATASPNSGKIVVDGRVERRLDALDRELPVGRRHPVLQPLQFGRDLGPDDVGPGGEELSELDVGGAEPIDRAGKPVRALDAAARDQIGRRQGGAREPGQRPRVDADEGAFAREHEPGARQPEGVTEGRQKPQDQSFQPEWIATTPPVSLT